MSNDKQFYIDLDKVVVERFDMGRFMEFTDNSDPLTSAFLDAIPDLPQGGSYEVTTEEGRPELLAFNIYGDTQYWWVLLAYNRKRDYRDFHTGDTIVFPTADAVENAYFTLLSQQRAAGR